MGLGKKDYGSRDVQLGYNSRSAKLSGVGWLGWDVGREEWTERRIIMNRMKDTQKFLEREIGVRNDKSENWEDWENWGSRCQLEEVDISGNLHLAKMGLSLVSTLVISSEQGAPV